MEEKPHIQQSRLMRSFILLNLDGPHQTVKIAKEATTPFLIMVKYLHDDYDCDLIDRDLMIEFDEYLLQIQHCACLEDAQYIFPEREKMVKYVIEYIQTQTPLSGS